MGADITLCDPHRAIVTGPARLRGERVESPDIRAGMAMLIAALCADGPQRDRQHPPDRPRLRAHRRAPARARRAASSASPPSPRPRLAPGDRHDPPDPQRHPRRAARRDARAARDHRARCAASSSAHGYGEVYTPALEYEERAARGGRRRRCPPTACSTTTASVLALRSDMTVPIARRRRDALRRRPSRRCASATSPTPTARVRPHRGQMREFLQAGIELVGAPGAGRDRRGADRAVRARSTPPGCAATASGSATRRCTRRCWRRFDVPDEARERLLHELGRTRLRRPRARGRARSGWPTRPPSCWCACRSCAAAPSVLGRRRRARSPTRVDGPARRARRCSTPDVAERVIFDLGLAPRPRLLHGRGVRGLRPGARRAARRRRALRRPARPLRPAAARGRLRARRRPPARRAGGRGAAGREPLRPDDRRAARRAVRRDARPARRARRRHRRGARQRPQAAVRGRRASSRCARPTCRPTSRPAPPTSASPARTC